MVQHYYVARHNVNVLPLLLLLLLQKSSLPLFTRAHQSSPTPTRQFLDDDGGGGWGPSIRPTISGNVGR